MKRSVPSDLAKQAKKTLKLSFKKTKLLKSALFHPSYRNENPEANLDDFDRMEFLGDSILNYVVCRKLYQQFPEANEGMLSRLRSILVSRKILFRISKEIRLLKVARLGKSLEAQPLFTKVKVFTDIFEALIAAIYFDKTFEAAEKFILKHFHSYFDAKKLFRLDPNPKSTLQELCQKTWQKLPIYSHQLTPKGVKTIVQISKTFKASAIARRRQDSEEKAARLLIRKIRQELFRRSKKVFSGRKVRKTS